MYRFVDDGLVLRLADGRYIPADAANVDYQAYLAWRAADVVNVPLPSLAPNPRIAEIKALLAGIDADSVRALRAVSRGRDVQEDRDRLDALDAAAVLLRAELAGL